MFSVKKIVKHSLIQNTFFLSIIKILDLILPLITIPYLTRVLDVNSFGILVILISSYSMANVLTDFGFGLSGPYYISTNRDNKKNVNRYLSSVILIKSLLAIAAILCTTTYLSISKEINQIDHFTYIIIGLIILSFAFQIQWFFLGIEKMKSITILASISKVSYFIFIFIFVPFFKNINSILFCTLVSNFITTLLYFKFTKKEGYSLVKISLIDIKNSFKDSFSFFISRLAVNLSTTSNGIIIGTFISPYSAAIYGVAEKIYNAAISLVVPLSNAMYPYMARNKNHTLFMKIVILLFFLSIIGAFIGYIISPWFFINIFGEEYKPSIYIFNYFLVMIPINTISILYGYSAFSIIDKPYIPNYTVVISSMIYILLIIILYMCSLLTISNLMLLLITIDTITLIIRISIFHFLWRKKQRGKRNTIK
ncbi:oligosaccharide flippase family protein [Morganella morganii]|uniref:oligosaccharide flippase family protein n=1 Tax=Morganella morganii TaxID=582 RepID=UPI001419C13F|nr:oligosaccharide flippase family protein [Morganella morganii]NIH20594.1 oligosaccharide flippase family protein [Morganella morganii]QXO72827.1 oligosaccharide flippase family protein [Morganella morganii]